MPDSTDNSLKAPKLRSRRRSSATPGADPTAARNKVDRGDATGRDYRYQHCYGVVLLIAAKSGRRPYEAIWCEQHEDLLAQRQDGLYDGYQIKTARPERGAWRLTDDDLVKSIGRFVDLVTEFGSKIGSLYFVSNTEWDEITPEGKDDRRRGRCPQLFLQHMRGCSTSTDIAEPYATAFNDLRVECSCEADELLTVLKRVDLILGPSRREIEASLAHEHLPVLNECRLLNPAELNAVRDNLVARVHRAASLQVTDPIRHLRAFLDPTEPDPVLVAKRILVADMVISPSPPSEVPDFEFVGEPSVQLGASLVGNVIDQKLEKAGLNDQIDYMRGRARAAEYTLIRHVHRRPEAFPKLLVQIEQRVYGEAMEAQLQARQQTAPYGPTMLMDVQSRLRRVAETDAGAIGHHGYDCLIGVAGLLTDACRIWWGPRFPIVTEVE